VYKRQSQTYSLVVTGAIIDGSILDEGGP